LPKLLSRKTWDNRPLQLVEPVKRPTIERVLVMELWVVEVGLEEPDKKRTGRREPVR